MTARWKLILGATLALLVLILALMPMRAGLSLLGPGVTARKAEGSVWSGVIRDAAVGGLPVGDVGAWLHPLPLLWGEARMGTMRPGTNGRTLLGGTIVSGSGRAAVEELDATIPLGAKLAPLPLSALVAEKLSVRFAGSRCLHAEGRVRAEVAANLPGLDLANGLVGTARCDGGALLLPLAGQSGLEKLDLRLTGDGSWKADLSVSQPTPELAAGLALAGFTSTGGDWRLTARGKL